MEIGKRLLAVRAARNLSQGDIKHRTGLLPCYISRVENGHSVPTLETLERWAKALEVEVYRLFAEGDEKPEPVIAAALEGRDRRDQKFLSLLRDINEADRKLILDIARKMAKRAA